VIASNPAGARIRWRRGWVLLAAIAVAAIFVVYLVAFLLRVGSPSPALGPIRLSDGAACNAGDVAVGVTLSAPHFSAGEAVTIRTTATNTTALPCWINESDCAAEPPTITTDGGRVVLNSFPPNIACSTVGIQQRLLPRQSSTRRYSWDQRICTLADGCPLTPVAPGRYSVVGHWWVSPPAAPVTARPVAFTIGT
jgi:hypothetical protein